MKVNKILIFLLTICILTSAFVFSVSAEEESITDLSGTSWTLQEGKSFSSIGTHYVDFKIGSDNYNYMSGSSKGGLSVDGDGGNGYFSNYSGLTITFIGGQDITKASLISWVKSNMNFNGYVSFECDGSSCPATDVNLDNVCDDCGMAFSMVREFTPNDFPSGYPSVPSVASDARYYLYRVHGSGSTYIVVYPSTVTPTYDTTKQNGYLTFSESYGSYRLTDNEWVLNNDDSPYSIGGTNNNSVDILYSSVAIKDQNGENFFPIPLWETIQGVTQGELTQTTLPMMVGTMKTLVVCGVGLMACLVALSLFGKVLGLYLKR